MIGRIRAAIGARFPRTTVYTGNGKRAWFVGANPRAIGISRLYCDGDVEPAESKRISAQGVSRAARSEAATGSIAVVRDYDSAFSDEDRVAAIEVPVVTRHTIPPRESVEALHKTLKTSSLRDDLRRLRKQSFSFEVETSPEAIRTFYEEYYVPFIRYRHDDDALVDSLEAMQACHGHGSELIWAMKDGERVGGMLNIIADGTYFMRWVGMRSGDADTLRQSIIPALYQRSLEAAVQHGSLPADIGKSLPFLGKNLARFKDKWGCVIHRDGVISKTTAIFLDLRHEAARDFLRREPTIIIEGQGLAAVRWAEPDETLLKLIQRDTKHFKGIDRWYVLGRREVIDSLEKNPKIVPVPVPEYSNSPQWIGDFLTAP